MVGKATFYLDYNHKILNFIAEYNPKMLKRLHFKIPISLGLCSHMHTKCVAYCGKWYCILFHLCSIHPHKYILYIFFSLFISILFQSIQIGILFTLITSGEERFWATRKQNCVFVLILCWFRCDRAQYDASILLTYSKYLTTYKWRKIVCRCEIYQCQSAWRWRSYI